MLRFFYSPGDIKKEPDNLTLSGSREDRIRTCDPLVPNQVFYRAELPPDSFKGVQI